MFQINNKKERKKEPVQSRYKRTRVYCITGLQMWKGAHNKATLFLFHCASGMSKDL